MSKVKRNDLYRKCVYRQVNAAIKLERKREKEREEGMDISDGYHNEESDDIDGEEIEESESTQTWTSIDQIDEAVARGEGPTFYDCYSNHNGDQIVADCCHALDGDGLHRAEAWRAYTTRKRFHRRSLGLFYDKTIKWNVEATMGRSRDGVDPEVPGWHHTTARDYMQATMEKALNPGNSANTASSHNSSNTAPENSKTIDDSTEKNPPVEKTVKTDPPSQSSHEPYHLDYIGVNTLLNVLPPGHDLLQWTFVESLDIVIVHHFAAGDVAGAVNVFTKALENQGRFFGWGDSERPEEHPLEEMDQKVVLAATGGEGDSGAEADLQGTERYGWATTVQKMRMKSIYDLPQRKKGFLYGTLGYFEWWLLEHLR